MEEKENNQQKSASEKQLRANRLNAQRSTGPRTAEGKASIRYNAMTHGLLAQAAVIPGEDETLFQRMAEEIAEQLNPVGAIETLLVDRIAACAWRLRRAVKVEAGLFVRELYDDAAKRAHNDMSKYWHAHNRVDLSVGGKVIDEEAYRQALERARAAEGVRDGDLGLLGAAFARDASTTNAFTKLSRYEAEIERSLHRSLSALQQMQQTRLQGTGAPQIAGAPPDDRA
jgi:hypothetical protein